MKRFLFPIGWLALVGCSEPELSDSGSEDPSLIEFELFLGSWQDETESRRLVLERGGSNEVRICYFEQLDGEWAAQLLGGVSEQGAHAEGALTSSVDPESPIELVAYPVEGGELDWNIVFGSGDSAATMRQTWSAPTVGQFTVVSETETDEGREGRIVSTLWTELSDTSFDCDADGR